MTEDLACQELADLLTTDIRISGLHAVAPLEVSDARRADGVDPEATHRELIEVQLQLLRDDMRLLTLTGAAGSGNTRGRPRPSRPGLLFGNRACRSRHLLEVVELRASQRGDEAADAVVTGRSIVLEGTCASSAPMPASCSASELIPRVSECR
jgi:hypothetical protein